MEARPYLLFVAAAAVATSAVAEQQRLVTDRASASVRQRVEGGVRVTDVVDVSYDEQSIWVHGDLRDVVRKITRRMTRASAGQRRRTTLTLEFLGLPRPLVFERHADQLVLDDTDFFDAVTAAGDETAHELTHYESGKVFLRYHERCVELAVPRTGGRWFLGYETAPDRSSLVHGRLHLARPGGLAQTVTFKAPNAEAFDAWPQWTPKLGVVSKVPGNRTRHNRARPVVELWAGDAAMPDNLNVVLTFELDDRTLDIVLPIVAGRLDGRAQPRFDRLLPSLSTRDDAGPAASAAPAPPPAAASAPGPAASAPGPAAPAPARAAAPADAMAAPADIPLLPDIPLPPDAAAEVPPVPLPLP